MGNAINRNLIHKLMGYQSPSSANILREDNQLFKPASEEDLESRPVYPNILEGQDLDDT